jgi:Na+/H+ antiporter NhaA
MESAMVLGMVLGLLVVKGLAIVTLAYIGARLALRHERRTNPR